MIDFDIRLEAEVTNNSGVWVSNPEDIIRRKTGESANYRVFYTFSSTVFGTFDDIIIEIDIADQYENIKGFYGVSLPENTSYTTDLSTNTKKLIINLGSDIPAGQSGIINFVVASNPGRGPDQYNMPSIAKISGNFTDGITSIPEYFSTSVNGPTWEVEAINMHSYTKTVTINGNIATDESDAYIIEYTLVDSITDYIPTDIVGYWGIESAYTVDTLPMIGSITPEVIYSNVVPYTVNGNQITWNRQPPTSNQNNKLIIRVRYPKSEIDAIGGLPAVGTLENQIDVHFNMIGGVEVTKSASVQYEIKPLPEPINGTPVIYKYSILYHEGNPFPGNGLLYADGEIEFIIRAGVNLTNRVANLHTITDLGLDMRMEDDTIVPMEYEDFEWSSMRLVSGSGKLYYQTNLDSNFREGPDITQDWVNFPSLLPNEYITSWKFESTDFMAPTASWLITVRMKLKQRTTDAPKFKEVINSASYKVDYSDTSLEGTVIAEIPVSFEEQINWQLPGVTTDSNDISLGSNFQIKTSQVILEETSVEVLSTNLYMILPPEFIFVPESYDTAVVTPNWNGTGKTLLHATFGPHPALHRTYFNQIYNFMVSQTAEITTYTIPVYYVTNDIQANNPNIKLLPQGKTAPDIYDFDNNGDTSQLVPYGELRISIVPSDIVNVLKMSKSFNDASFQINNDTNISSEEHFNYSFFVRNDSSEGMTYVTIIDIFPYLGDKFGSTWAPTLMEIPIVPDYVKVYYSTSTDPKMEPINSSGTGEWTTVPPENLEDVKALKYDFGDKVFEPGEATTVYLSMTAPKQAPEASRAYNSIDYIASAISESGTVTQYLPAFSPPAYARITFRDFDTFVGDFVWQDINFNGLIDPGEPGINGVPVELLTEQGEVVYSTITANNEVTGEPGYYKFEGVWPGKYIARFPITLEDGSYITNQRVGDDPAINSVPDPQTGLSHLFEVFENIPVDDIDAGYCLNTVYKPSIIGDYVWQDLNKNGIQESNEPGINGVLVSLYDGSDALITQTLTSNNPTTGRPGYYEFSILTPGSYYVNFPISILNGMTLTIQNAGSNEDINSKANPLTGNSDLILVGEDEKILNIDAGYILPDVPPSLIGDFVWNDLNKNGIQDPGEPGINNVLVQLLNEHGTVIRQTYTTNNTSGSPGYYEFEVEPGNYMVKFPTEILDGMTLTIQNASDFGAGNSKPDTLTGIVPLFTIGPGENNFEVDAGYITNDVPIIGEIGDFVWNDINGNGIQDIGEPGINGVVVELVNLDDNTIETVITQNNPITGEAGYYIFENVQEGRYIVRFPIQIENDMVLTTQNAGNDSNINSKANQLTGYTNIIRINENNMQVLNIDAGYIYQEDTSIIKKCSNKKCVCPCECISYDIYFKNNSGNSINGLEITDSVCCKHFDIQCIEVYIGDNNIRPNIIEGYGKTLFTMIIDDEIKNNECVHIKVVGKISCCAKAGKHCNKVIAKYNEKCIKSCYKIIVKR